MPFGVGCSHPALIYRECIKANAESPVPFGVGCSHPKTLLRTVSVLALLMSPVPFGVGCSHPFIENGSTFWMIGVTSAFRRGVLSPLGSCTCNGDTSVKVTSAFRRGVLSPHNAELLKVLQFLGVSPVPFGVGCSHPLHPSNSLSFNCPTLPQVTSPFFIGMPSAILAPETRSKPVTHCKSTTPFQVATCRFLPLSPHDLGTPEVINHRPTTISHPG